VFIAPQKAAVRSFARTWTSDLKSRRIRVNAVSPGYTDTAPWRSIEGADQVMQTISSGIPLGRFGTPDEIAKAALFSRPTTAATSRERKCLWMAGSHRCRRIRARSGLRP